MNNKCKHCGSAERVKNGFVQGKQRYECLSCGKAYREGDLREKYNLETKLRVIKWYLEGAGIMSIEPLAKRFSFCLKNNFAKNFWFLRPIFYLNHSGI